MGGQEDGAEAGDHGRARQVSRSDGEPLQQYEKRQPGGLADDAPLRPEALAQGDLQGGASQEEHPHHADSGEGRGQRRSRSSPRHAPSGPRRVGDSNRKHRDTRPAEEPRKRHATAPLYPLRQGDATTHGRKSESRSR